MAKKIDGKKFAGKHTTYIDAAELVVKFLCRDKRVKKISLGIIRSCNTGTGARSIKSKNTISGLEVTVRGSSYVQTLWVYLEQNDENAKNDISAALSLVFNK